MPDRAGLTHGQVRLRCDDPHADVTCLLGDDSPHLTGGVGGWDVTARPRQIAMTTWGGVEPFQLSLALLLDGFAKGKSVERDLTELVAVARGDAEAEPGLLRVQGLTLPARRWVIEGIDFGDAVLSASSERTRQALTLTLREYVPPSYLNLRRSATLGSKGKTRVVAARHGDTPARIAQRQRCHWTDLRDLNPGTVRKANQVLKTGTRLRVPVAKRRDRKAATTHRSS